MTAAPFRPKSNIRKNNMDLDLIKYGYFGLAVLRLGSEKIVDDDLPLCMFSMVFRSNLLKFLNVFDSFSFIFYL
jgi:hypothetical protein